MPASTGAAIYCFHTPPGRLIQDRRRATACRENTWLRPSDLCSSQGHLCTSWHPWVSASWPISSCRMKHDSSRGRVVALRTAVLPLWTSRGVEVHACSRGRRRGHRYWNPHGAIRRQQPTTCIKQMATNTRSRREVWCHHVWDLRDPFPSRMNPRTSCMRVIATRPVL
ncbi:hypothetical protein GQ53DRAFT_168808 [Thozetella sp. PMI_491]|nr:hypothetical protein GQ53DRAFT_168808 [Thozetella sp. PMI_491]